MMTKILHILLSLCLMVFLQLSSKAQPADWIRVQSDNGEFSIAVPAQYNYFYDRAGASSPAEESIFALKDTHILNAYVDHTLISFEFYDESTEALDQLYQSARTIRISESDLKTSEIKSGGFTIRQVIEKTKNYYLIRQFFHSKKYIYILTAASRNGETAPMKEFLSSLVFKPNTKDPPDAKIPALGSLKPSAVNVITQNVKSATKDETAPMSANSPPGSLILLAKPRASFTNSARQNLIQGEVQFRITLSENGFTPKIEVIKGLAKGLTRQALFAALRIKFLPEEKDGHPISIEKVIPYSFTIY